MGLTRDKNTTTTRDHYKKVRRKKKVEHNPRNKQLDDRTNRIKNQATKKEAKLEVVRL